MKYTTLLFIFGVFLFSATLASAGSTCLSVNSKTTAAYLTEIPALNSQLSSCTITVPDSAFSLIGSGNILVSVSMNSGSVEQFYATVDASKTVTALEAGKPSSHTFEILLGEDTMDSILNSNDAFNEALKGIKNKDIKVKANSFIGSIKWFFAKFFLPNPGSAPSNSAVPSGPAGKPDYCDETYLQGHRDYANNKELWDSYSSDTDKVCQSQYGRGIPSPCIHTVQLSVDGNPYYLCWYNE